MNPCSGSGGVAILSSNMFLQEFTIDGMDTSFTSVLPVELKHKKSNFTLVCICVYVPPETTRLGRESDIIFEHLVQTVYQFENADSVYVFGDLNTRINDKCDYIVGVDEVISRCNIDVEVNKHGDV